VRSCRFLPGDNKKRMDQELSPEDVIKISSLLKHFLFLTLWCLHPALYWPVFPRRSGSTSFPLFKLMHHWNYKSNWCSSVKSVKWYSRAMRRPDPWMHSLLQNIRKLSSPFIENLKGAESKKIGSGSLAFWKVRTIIMAFALLLLFLRATAWALNRSTAKGKY